MPTIAFISPKGGVGKSTSAFLLTAELAKLYDVTFIDADPNHPIEDWTSGGGTPPRMTVLSDVDEDTIIERIEDAASKTPFVIVDLEGTASKTVIYAISQADYVIIPTQGSALDAKQASRAIKVVIQSKKPYAVLLTRTNQLLPSRTFAPIQKRIIHAGIAALETSLHAPRAFKAVYALAALGRVPRHEFVPTDEPDLDKARVNVLEFVHEVVMKLSVVKALQEEDEQARTEIEGAA
jgi:chromosome partitioning protein